MEILNLRGATQSIRLTAKKFGVSEQEMRCAMQEFLDAAWAQDESTQGKQKLLQLFPNGKPCLEHFILRLAKEL